MESHARVSNVSAKSVRETPWRGQGTGEPKQSLSQELGLAHGLPDGGLEFGANPHQFHSKETGRFGEGR